MGSFSFFLCEVCFSDYKLKARVGDEGFRVLVYFCFKYVFLFVSVYLCGRDLVFRVYFLGFGGGFRGMFWKVMVVGLFICLGFGSSRWRGFVRRRLVVFDGVFSGSWRRGR